MADQKREVEVADAAAEETHGISPARSADYDETYEIYRKQDAIDLDPEEAKSVLGILRSSKPC